MDRLWPRGLPKKQILHALWLKDISPSPVLRKWFNHDPANWIIFRQRYQNELASNPSVKSLLDRAKEGRLKLLYAARNPDYNHALVLRDYLLSQYKTPKELILCDK